MGIIAKQGKRRRVRVQHPGSRLLQGLHPQAQGGEDGRTVVGEILQDSAQRIIVELVRGNPTYALT